MLRCVVICPSVELFVVMCGSVELCVPLEEPVRVSPCLCGFLWLCRFFSVVIFCICVALCGSVSLCVCNSCDAAGMFGSAWLCVVLRM